MVYLDNRYDKKRMQVIRQEEEGRLIKQLADKYGYKYVNLVGMAINPQGLNLISEEEARSARVVIFNQNNRKLRLAIRNPNRVETKKLIEKLESEKWQLEIFMCSTFSLEHAWSRYKEIQFTRAVDKGVLSIDGKNVNNLIKKLKKVSDVADEIMSTRTLNTSRRISETLDKIFAGAIALKASDIHIEPKTNGVRLRYRLNGALCDVIVIQQSIYDKMVSRLKLLSGMKLNIHNRSQDGRFSFVLEEQEIEARVSSVPGTNGESVVIRLLDPSVASFKLDNLDFGQVLKKTLERELSRPNGLIITTGPTGSGKTTLLYACLRKIKTAESKIITIEDPIEYKLEGIVQTQVSNNFGFATGLRSVLRQDPDIILIGEIRDEEVAKVAMNAAQTGHLVLSTLHSNSAVGGFLRLADLGVDYKSFGNSINLIMGQRLLRMLCSKCKQSYSADEEEINLVRDLLSEHPAKPKVDFNSLVLYEPKGCENCNGSGYKGRIGVYEAIAMDRNVEETILRDPREHIIKASAKKTRDSNYGTTWC